MPQEKLGLLDKGAWYQLKRHLGLVRPSFPYDGGIYEIVGTAGAQNFDSDTLEPDHIIDGVDLGKLPDYELKPIDDPLSPGPICDLLTDAPLKDWTVLLVSDELFELGQQVGFAGQFALVSHSAWRECMLLYKKVLNIKVWMSRRGEEKNYFVSCDGDKTLWAKWLRKDAKVTVRQARQWKRDMRNEERSYYVSGK